MHYFFLRRGLRASLLVLALVSLLTGVGGASAPALQPEAADVQSPYEHPGARYLSERYGISMEAALLRERLTDLGIAARPVAERMFPDTFAGLWMDHDDGGALKIGFTRESAKSAAAVSEELGQLLPATPVDAAFSVAALAGLSDELAGQHTDLRRRIPRLRGWYLDEPSNAVVLEIAPGTRREAEETASSFNPDMLRIEELDFEPEQAALACGSSTEYGNRRACASPLRGGIQLQRSGSNCTLGFNVEDPISGAQGVITAGHCEAGTGQTWSHNGRTIGPSVQRVVGGAIIPGTVDVLQINFNAAGDTNWDQSRWVFRNNDAHAHQVRRNAPWIDTLLPGSTLCKSGITTNETCGLMKSGLAFIYSVNYQQAYYDQIKVAYGACLRPGDSGAPLYRIDSDGQLRAFGLATIGLPDWTSCVGLGEMLWASKITNIEAALGVRVLHGP